MAARGGSKAGGKNSSKTARVLGLLTNPPEEREPAPTTPPPAPAPVYAPMPTAAAPVAQIAPIIRVEPEHPAPKPVDDRIVEAELRSALENALREEELQQKLEEGKTMKESRPFEPSQVLSDPLPDAEELTLPAFDEDAGPGTVEEAPPTEPMPTGEPVQVELEDATGPRSRMEPDIYCFNITQALVEAKVDKYMKLFGLCACPRCRIDVVALALSSLPPKYVVAHHHEIVPMLSMYESKNNAAIVSAVMNACKIVMQHPRHETATS